MSNVKRFLGVFAILTLFPAVVTAQSERYTRSGYAACGSKDAFKTLLHYVAQDELDAARDLIATRSCVVLPSNRKVVVEHSTFSGMIKIRFVESTLTVWTVEEAVTQTVEAAITP